jgi:hypothetical protein
MKNKNKTPADIFDYLKGNWNLERTIDSDLFSKKISATGDVIIAENSTKKNTLNYKESVEVEWDWGDVQKASKQYEFVLDDKRLMQFDCLPGDKKDKFTEMYTLDFKYGEGVFPKLTGGYRCNDDIYNVVYSFFGNNKFTIQYTVSGPSKSFSTLTEFTRLDEYKEGIDLLGDENNDGARRL